MHAVLGLCMAEMRGSPAPAVADLVFAAALTVPDGGVTMQCVLQPDGGFTVYGAAPDGGWTEHASGRIEAESGPPPPSLDLAAERARLAADRSEEHTSELQPLMRISYAVFCLQKIR